MNDHLLRKYFSGSCTPAEELEVLKWFKNRAPNEEQQQTLYRIWQETGGEESASEPARDRVDAFRQIIRAIEVKELHASETGDTGPESGRSWWVWWLGAAAAVMLVVGRFVFNAPAPSAQPVKVSQVAALYGQRKMVRLEDGSVVHLNSGSRIRYPEHFRKSKREVELDGEAFFTVKRDTIRPFLVRSGRLVTQVLGTSFNIKYRQNTDNTAVSLSSGSVQVRQIGGKGPGRVVQLIPGEQLIYTRQKEGFEVRPFNRDEVFSWQRGILNFRKSSLPEVVEKLENWYGVQVVMSGKIPHNKNAWQYSGNYENQSLTNVLTGIAFVKKFSFRIQGNVVTMNFD